MSEENGAVDVPATVVNLFGTEYDFNSDLDDTQRRIVAHIEDLNKQIEPLQRQIEQKQASVSTFVNALNQSLSSKDDEVEDAEVIEGEA